MGIRLEFADSRVCRHCGLPAARLGDTWIGGDGLLHWESKPLELAAVSGREGTRPVKESDTGAFVLRVKSHGEGRGKSETAVYGLAYTHECRGDQFGGKSCGALTLAATMQGDMPDGCYFEEIAP
jgi:hypothetical protein